MKNKLAFHIILLISLCVSFKGALAQQADEELAAQFFSNKEYAKAADMYEKLLNKNARSMYFYDNLLSCYIAQTDFQKAQKLVSKQSRKFEENSFYQVDQGYVLNLQKKNKEANEVFDKLLQKMPANDNSIYELSKAFEKRNEKQYAVDALVKGRKILKSELIFAGELGSLYSEMHIVPNMVEEYLNVLVQDERLTDEVQGYLQNSLQNAAEYAVLKQALLKKMKEYPERNTFPEMLIWYHVQNNEYESALIYAKSLDRKNKENGRRLIELGLLAQSNEKWDASIAIFKQVQSLGKDKPFYAYSKNEEIGSRSKKILSGNYTNQELVTLDAEYELLLNEFGKTPSMASTMRNQANLRAFYLNSYDSAITEYEQIIKMPRVDRNLQAECKLELADFYVMKGEVWEAMLLYGQVDKDFLQEPLGQEAKFRNARLSYYLGEFDWAKAQLDVLKTATTQLIANNALELSLLIQDNTVDSNTEPLKMFATADLNYVQNNTKTALQQLDSISLLFPKHSLSDDILYKKAQIYYRKKDYQTAALYFQKVVDEYGSDILGDNALYQLAKLNQNQLNNPEAAKKLYEKFIDTYSGSFFLTDCRKQFRLLRGDILE
ncbi:MAG: hypothetical protein CFE21_05395 [Bacteroidetes bacterium B1(2017)]|nr:MAG: hypothetical protein CFE21_05395 [Bacteroidetes bacterium B1(2017)]